MEHDIPAAVAEVARMTELLHDAIIGFNAFVIVYMIAQGANQLILTGFGWREISEYVKRRSLRDYATIATSELSVPVSLIIPAYNEEAVILESVQLAPEQPLPHLRGGRGERRLEGRHARAPDRGVQPRRGPARAAREARLAARHRAPTAACATSG